MTTFDVHKFIELVRSFRVIYDVNFKVPNKKQEVADCWLQITSQMTQNFKDLGKKEQLIKCEKLKRTWKSMIDNMRRTVKLKKNTYVHYNEMKFVIPYLGRRWKSANRRIQEDRNGTSQGVYKQLLDHIANKPYLLSLLNKISCMENTDSYYIMNILSNQEFVSAVRMLFEFPEVERYNVLSHFIASVQKMHLHQNESDLHNSEHTAGYIAPLNEISTCQNETNLIDTTILNTTQEDALTTQDSLGQSGSVHSERPADTFYTSALIKNDSNTLVANSSPCTTDSDVSTENFVTGENNSEINDLQNTNLATDVNPEHELNPAWNGFDLNEYIDNKTPMNIIDLDFTQLGALDDRQFMDMSLGNDQALLDKNVNPLLSSVLINSVDSEQLFAPIY